MYCNLHKKHDVRNVNFLLQWIKGEDVKNKFGITYPHTVHCIPSGDVMICTLGDSEGNAAGNFYVIDGKTFELREKWNKGTEQIKGHDFWYQPRINIMISTELGAPNKFTKGFFADDLANGTIITISQLSSID